MDYRLWFLSDEKGRLRVPLRGPRLYQNEEDYIVFIGAAQTFGRLAEKPFPTLIAEMTGRPVLNLGISGAGPSRFLDRRLLNFINGASHCFIQIMSGRSVTAGQLETQANQGMVKFISGPNEGRQMLAHVALNTIRSQQGEDAYREQVHASQSAYIRQVHELLGAITPPKTLLWMSKRDPHDALPVTDRRIMQFPQIVDVSVVQRIREGHDLEFLDCTYGEQDRQMHKSPQGELIDNGTEWVSAYLDDDAIEILEEKGGNSIIEPRGRLGAPRLTRRAFGYYYPSQKAHYMAAGKILGSSAFKR